MCQLEYETMKSYESMGEVLLLSAVMTEDEEHENELVIIGTLLLTEADNISADVRLISEPVERKYLRFNSPSLTENFAT